MSHVGRYHSQIPNTMAKSQLPISSVHGGKVANLAEEKKINKYSCFSKQFHFVPIAIETLGAWGKNGLSLIQEIGKRLTRVTDDPRETTFLKQRISLAIQSGNAATILGLISTRQSSDNQLHN